MSEIIITEKAQELLNKPLKNGLYIVSTPIGNKLDITLHALKIFQEAKFILCEDTRKTNALLQFHGISRKGLLICNEYADKGRLTHFVNLARSNPVAITSDAGTPLVCDPGYELVQMCKKSNIEIFVIPGACALIAGATYLGENIINTTFLGFYNKNSIKKIKNGEKFALFVAPQDIQKLAEDLKKTEQKWEIKIAQNITKEDEKSYIYNEENSISSGEILVLFQST